ncbi:iron uptake protein [Pseudorhodoferax sp.]|uniref:iron uptake protein n=1 Tax=Pseudorhodoferax sp. TaxID=1993553 RepID=UPI002DD6723B|nr:iron uptake protein [Pseudorhodoferax sp.]
MHAPSVSRAHLLARIAAAVFGGYAFAWGLVALGMAGLFALGMPFHDAEHLTAMLAMLAYLVVFLWAFAARSLPRVWLVLAGGGALMTGAAALLQTTLVR